ncbi:MAG: hypothetical protein OHK93_003672 [Ramalina farinacea]|uniref:F-box protein n=1 Tax=Ramalina farinacea TaxID=258253 RepID=A0AA43QWY5_9LECA|nr:hypothetical protein [Ramalina farinacea]
MASFLGLPGELRNSIYVVLFTADGKVPHDIASYLAPPTCTEALLSRSRAQKRAIKRRSRQRKDGHVAFLRTCKLVNREATPLLYRHRPLMLALRPNSYILERGLVKIFELTFASKPRSYLLNCGHLLHSLRTIQNIELSIALAPQAESIRDMRFNLLPLKGLHKPNSCHFKLHYDMSFTWGGGTTTMLEQLLDGVSCKGLEVFKSLTFSSKLLNMSSNGWSARVDDFAEPDIDAPDECIMTAVEKFLSPQYGPPTEWNEAVKGEAARRITFYPQKHLAP